MKLRTYATAQGKAMKTKRDMIYFWYKPESNHIFKILDGKIVPSNHVQGLVVFSKRKRRFIPDKIYQTSEKLVLMKKHGANSAQCLSKFKLVAEKDVSFIKKAHDWLTNILTPELENYLEELINEEGFMSLSKPKTREKIDMFFFGLEEEVLIQADSTGQKIAMLSTLRKMAKEKQVQFNNSAFELVIRIENLIEEKINEVNSKNEYRF
jgi:hypothetical protein